MGRQTYTRAQLRRDLAIRMSMPFALRVPDGHAVMSGTGLTTTIIDSINLIQQNDFWNGQWIYVTSTGTESLRKIVDYAKTTHTLTLDSPLPTVSSTNMQYEIHSVFNAIEMNNAINTAIRDAYPAFFDTKEDMSLFVQESRLEYDLSSIDPKVATIHGVWLERPSGAQHGKVMSSSYDVGGDKTTLVVSGVDVTKLTGVGLLACYDGSATYKGTLLEVTASGANLVCDGDHQLQVDDEFLLFDSDDQDHSWYPLKHIRYVPKEWPNSLYIGTNISSYLGYRMKLLYSSAPTQLTADTDTTTVPSEYIMLSAMATLFSSRMNDNRVDRQMYASLSADYKQQSEIYKMRNMFRGMDTEIWMETSDGNEFYQDNPMNWS